MSVEESLLVKKLFIAALELPEGELEIFLSQACGTQGTVRAEVVSLLQAYKTAGTFLEASEPSSVPTAVPASQVGGPAAVVDEKALDRFRWLILDEQETIDRYKLLDVIGEGGYGLVFRAQQEIPVRRIVALKIIKKGLETQAVRARFEAERQTLALMEHPNIAKLYDAGTTESDRPYFVMELVQGKTITRFCDERQLSIRQRVKLFVTVCQAVHHAHQKGIIHRDLKPSNILVSESDKEISPKVIDFGVSQTMSDHMADSAGHPIVGTPQYMSPELLASGNAKIDIRSDVYSLGAVLHELLTGIPASINSVHDVVTNDDKHRPGTGPNGGLPHDLVWIVTRSVQPEITQRYNSVSELAADLQRYLENRPVQAAPYNLWYLCNRFFRRNRAVVALSGILAVALVLSLLAVSIALINARHSRDKSIAGEKQTAASKADAVAKLRDAYLQQARAAQRSRWPGQRMESLKAISLAAEIAPSIELRNEAIACMCLPDIQPVQTWTLAKPELDLTFTGNMDRYATASPDGIVRIFRTSDHQLLGQLPDQGYPADGQLRFSPDDRHLLAYFARGSFATQIWDVDALKPVYRLPSRRQVAFSCDGKQFAVNVVAQQIELRSLPSGAFIQTIDAGGSIGSMRFNPEDTSVAVRGDEGDLRLLHLPGGEVTSVQNESSSVMSYAWHPDNKMLAYGGDDSLCLIHCIDVDTGELQSVMKGHLGPPVNLQFTHDGDFLLSGSWDGWAKLWNVRSGTELLTIENFGGNLQLSNDDSLLSFSGGTVHNLMRLIKSNECRVFRTLMDDRAIWHADVSPDGSLVAATTAIGVRFWNLATGTPTAFVSCPGPRSILFSADGTEIFVSTHEGVRRWNVANVLGRFEVPQTRVNEAATCGMSMSADQSRMVFGDTHGNLFVADPRHLSDAVRIGQHTLPPRFVAVSPDGRWAASSVRRFDQTLTFKVWNLQSRQLEVELPASPNMTELGEVAFSPNGKLLVTADHPAYRWYSVGDWKLLRETNRGHPGMSGCIAFSPDNKIVALSGLGRAINLCDAQTGKELASLDSTIPFGAGSFRFSPDSNYLVVCGTSPMVWNISLIRRELGQIHLDW